MTNVNVSKHDVTGTDGRSNQCRECQPAPTPGPPLGAEAATPATVTALTPHARTGRRLLHLAATALALQALDALAWLTAPRLADTGRPDLIPSRGPEKPAGAWNRHPLERPLVNGHTRCHSHTHARLNDGVHLTDEGHAYLADRIQPIIDEVLAAGQKG